MPTEEHSNCQLLYQEIDELIQNSQTQQAASLHTTKTQSNASSPAKSETTRFFAWGSNSSRQICTGREFAADPIPIAFD